MRKCIIFDAVGVIFEGGSNADGLIIPYVKKLNCSFSSEEINALYTELSLGKISSSLFWDKLGLGCNYPLVETTYLDEYFKLNSEFCSVAQKLKKNYSLAMLSNDASEWSLYLRNKYNLDKYFDEIVISGDVGYRKPTAEIYKIVLDRIKCRGDECIFIDDRYINLFTAQELDMDVVKYKEEKGCAYDYRGEYDGKVIESLCELLKIL